MVSKDSILNRQRRGALEMGPIEPKFIVFEPMPYTIVPMSSWRMKAFHPVSKRYCVANSKFLSDFIVGVSFLNKMTNLICSNTLTTDFYR